jgi:hypothetical protein
MGHILHRNCFLKHFIEERRESNGRRRRRRKQLVDDFKENIKILELERVSTGPHSAEILLQKGLRTSHKTDLCY